jgi:hypothetical protein
MKFCFFFSDSLCSHFVSLYFQVKKFKASTEVPINDPKEYPYAEVANSMEVCSLISSYCTLIIQYLCITICLFVCLFVCCDFRHLLKQYWDL